MVKVKPVWQLVGKRSFATKGEAEKYAVSERRRKSQMGYKTRYEIDQQMEGGFRVREFVYAVDEEGKVTDA